MATQMTLRKLSLSELSIALESCVRAHFSDCCSFMPGLIRQKLEEVYGVSAEEGELFLTFVMLVERGFLGVQMTKDPNGNHFDFFINTARR